MSFLRSILAIVTFVQCVSLDGAGVNGGRRVLSPSAAQRSSDTSPGRRCPSAGSDDANDMDSNPRPSGCPQSVPDEELPSSEQWQSRLRSKQTRLFAIQREILERLGIRHRPNVTATNLTAEELDSYEEILRQADSQDRTIYQRHFYAKRFYTLLPSCSLPRNSDSLWTEVSPKEMRFHFPVEQIEITNRQRETRILVASLKLRRKTIPRKSEHETLASDERSEARTHSSVDTDDPVIRIITYAYAKPIKRGRKEQKKVVSTLFVNRNSGLTWTRIDIRSAVEDWMKRANRNYGLQVTVESGHRLINPYDVFEEFNCSARTSASPSILTFPITDDMDGDSSSSSSSSSRTSSLTETNGPLDVDRSRKLPSAFLDVVTVDVPKRRSSRNHRDLQPHHQRSFCGLEKMFISFAEIGWNDWIVQPKGFETGFCRGTCAKRTGSRTMNKKYSADLTSLGLSECCGPVRARPLSVLQYNAEGKLSISVFDDFVVTDCGCRR